MKYPIIGVAGRKGAGKDTAVSQLTVDCGTVYSFDPTDSAFPGQHFFKRHLVKFAAPLKLMLAAHLEYCGVARNMIEEILSGSLKEYTNEHLCDQTSRWAQQSLGTEWGRTMIGDTIWTDAFQARCGYLLKQQGLQCHYGIVCTDMRFDNEVNLVRKMGGFTMKIVDPNFVKPEHDHPSEGAIDAMEVDLVIENDKTQRTAEEFAIHVARVLMAKGALT